MGWPWAGLNRNAGCRMMGGGWGGVDPPHHPFRFVQRRQILGQSFPSHMQENVWDAFGATIECRPWWRPGAAPTHVPGIGPRITRPSAGPAGPPSHTRTAPIVFTALTDRRRLHGLRTCAGIHQPSTAAQEVFITHDKKEWRSFARGIPQRRDPLNQIKK